MNAPAAQDITVNYIMSGKAVSGSDYTMSGNQGQIIVPAGETSGTATLTALQHASSGKAKPKTAVMTLQPGSGYKFSSGGGKKNKSKAPSATVTISG
jgi:hypothetical protein